MEAKLVRCSARLFINAFSENILSFGISSTCPTSGATPRQVQFYSFETNFERKAQASKIQIQGSSLANAVIAFCGNCDRLEVLGPTLAK